MANILILNGPNLNRLGARDVYWYGQESWEEIWTELTATFSGHHLRHAQSNHEGQLIDWIQAAEAQGTEGLVLNPGACSHSSYALHDAILDCSLPVVEVHLSNLAQRSEPWRRQSVVSPACVGVVSGFGKLSYRLGVQALLAGL